MNRLIKYRTECLRDSIEFNSKHLEILSERLKRDYDEANGALDGAIEDLRKSLDELSNQLGK